MRRVVITGMGVLAPNAHGLDDFEQALRSGKSGIRFVPQLKELRFGCQVAGIPHITEETKRSYFTEEQLFTMSTSMVYTGIAAGDCWCDAGFELPSCNASADWGVGAIIGIGAGNADVMCALSPQIDAGRVRRLGSVAAEQMICSAPSAWLAGYLGLGGHVTVSSSACAAGTEAIANAFHLVKEGRAKRMLAGGVEADTRYVWGCFDAMRVLARNFNDCPERASRPMSATACGFVPSAGAGIVMIEDYDEALRRGARIYAEIVGAHVNCGGHRNGGSMTAPNPEGVQRCIRAAISQARIKASDVSVINGHLTATMADRYEIRNWQQALDVSTSDFPVINSTKSMIGHALGAAGGIECVASVLQLYKSFVHASINCEDIHPEIEAFSDSIPRVSRDVNVEVVAKSSFGFGDVNACLIFKKIR
jgi:3-oxoacyl-(acyl-carrier-protein) synthase